MSKVVAVDFDGVIVEDRYPEIGEENTEIVAFLNELHSEGVKLILWTRRTGEELNEAVRYCRALGIEFDAVNENLHERIAQRGSDCRKVDADYYIDSRNILLPGIYSPEQILKEE